jgi:hypothetical protein
VAPIMDVDGRGVLASVGFFKLLRITIHPKTHPLP